MLVLGLLLRRWEEKGVVISVSGWRLDPGSGPVM